MTTDRTPATNSDRAAYDRGYLDGYDAPTNVAARTQLAEEQAKGARLESEKAALVDAVQHAIDRGVGVGWELQPIVANLAEAAKAHNRGEQAKGAKALAEDIRAGVRHHVKECEAELRGQGYVCIHRINSATATVVLRLAKLHRAALQEEK